MIKCIHPIMPKGALFMKALLRLLPLLLLTGLLCLGAEAEPAAELTDTCVIRAPGVKVYKVNRMLDRNYGTAFRLEKRRVMHIRSKGAAIGALYLRFFNQPQTVDLQVEEADGWVTVATAGADFVDEWVALPRPAQEVRLRSSTGGEVKIDELYVYGEGEPPSDVHLWSISEKADIMLLSAHPDDELLWFGGLIPTYAGDRGKVVQLVYATSSPLRKLELLDALWLCGDRSYPYFCDLPDRIGRSIDSLYSLWKRDRFFGMVTEAIRRFQPDVLITQDIDGEYGHTAHKAVADAAIQCYTLAADATVFTDSAASYGTWQVKKLYIHLWPEHQLHMDWSVPLAAFGGETGLSVASRALDCHRSQRGTWSMNSSLTYDNTAFGLYATEVGPDERCDDLLEHIGEPVTSLPAILTPISLQD